MSPPARDRLYGLLPALYRIRDAEDGQQALRAFLALVEEEIIAIHADIDDLYENWFIETCWEWVVPYIGDLLGVSPLRPVDPDRHTARAYVANTLNTRQAKGTLALLEQLARDVSGHPARAVEFFRRLITTPNLNHLRPETTATPDLRRTASLDRLGTPFEIAYRTPEVRRIESERGRFNVPNIGLYLWPYQAYPLTGVTARRLGPGRFSFDPFGRDAPLFNAPDPEENLTGIAEERHVPTPIRRRALHDELEELRRRLAALPLHEHGEAEAAWARKSVFFDPGRVAFSVEVQRIPGGPFECIPPRRLHACHLADWRRPAPLADPGNDPIPVFVDPILGRLTVPEGMDAPVLRVGYHYGFSDDLGGGPYDREAEVRVMLGEARQTLASVEPSIDWQVGVSPSISPTHAETIVPTLAQAVALWNDLPPGKTGVIVVMDSTTYEESLTGTNLLRIPEGSTLLILAGLWPRHEPGDAPPERRVGEWDASTHRPHLLGDMSVRGTAPAGSKKPGHLLISGLAIQGHLTVLEGHLGRLHLSHCTITAAGDGGTSSFALSVSSSDESPGLGNDSLSVRLDASLSGPIGLAATVATLTLRDCLLDAALGFLTGDPPPVVVGPRTNVSVTACSLLGEVDVYELHADHSLFAGSVMVTRRQQGCLRFCFIPLGSITPRRYRCQPDLEAKSRVELAGKKAKERGAILSDAEIEAIHQEASLDLLPQFASTRFGDAGYGHLLRTTPDPLRRGGEGGSEIGVFHRLGMPIREANLRAVLVEHLRMGLEAGLLYIS